MHPWSDAAKDKTPHAATYTILFYAHYSIPYHSKWCPLTLGKIGGKLEFLWRIIFEAQILEWGVVNKLPPGFLLLLSVHSVPGPMPTLLLQLEIIRIIPSILPWFILRFHISVSGHWERGSTKHWLRAGVSPLCRVLLVTWCNSVHSRYQPSMKWVCMPWRTPWPADQPRGWSQPLRVSGGPPQMTTWCCVGAEARSLLCVWGGTLSRAPYQASPTLGW